MTISILDKEHPDLLAFYTMGNITGTTLVDESGHVNGTLFNPLTVPGVFGNALKFDGGYCSFGNVPEWKTPQGAFSAWLEIPYHPTDINAGRALVAHRSSTGGEFMGITIRTDGKIVFFYSGNGMPYTELVTSSPAGVSGEFCSVIIGSDGMSNRCIVNGIELSLVKSVGENNQGRWFASIPNLSVFELCRLQTGGVNYLGTLAIDQARLFKRFPTAEEVKQLFSEMLSYEIKGFITQDGSPVSTQVRLYDALSGALIETLNTNTNGEFQTTIERGDPVFAMAVPYSGYQPLVHGPIIPKLRNS